LNRSTRATQSIVANAPTARRLTRHDRAAILWLLGPAILIVTVFLILPLALTLRYSFNRFVPGQLMADAITLENYVKFATDPFYQHVLLTTLAVSVLTTGACLVIGFPMAYLIARASDRVKRVLIVVVVLPLFMGNAVRTAGWMVLLGDRGLVNATLALLGITTEPLVIMYTPTAVLIGLVSVLLPFMVMTLQSVIEGIGVSLEEAAANLGANPARVFARIIVPLAIPGAIAGTTLCFILAMNAYATPVLLGGPQFQMMAPILYEQITRVGNWPFGSALAFVLMATTLVLTLVSSAAVMRRYGR
jgi:putative spermidine/putrescine transport system permease protein